MTTKRRSRPVSDSFRALIRPVADQPWAIDLASLRRIVDLTRDAAAFDPDELQAFGFGGSQPVGQSNPVRVIPIFGPITNHASFWSEYFGGTSVDRLRADVNAAVNDPTVKAVVFQVASPGGEVMGMTEFAAELRALRGGAKPLVAMIDPYAHSAALWLAAQCDEVVLTPSGTAGSVGIYTVHEEYSRALDTAGITETVIGSTVEKTETLDVIPLSSDAENAIRNMIMAHAAMFVADVAKGRNVSVDAVNKTFGQGRVLMAKQALEVGMVDRIDTMANTIARLSKGGRTAGARAETGGLEPRAEGDQDEPDETPETVPFTERVTRLAAAADELVTHAQERGRLRAKEGRPPISAQNLKALRSTRTSLEELIASGEVDPAQPAPSPVVEPPVVVATPPPAATPVARSPRPPLSDDAWAEFLEKELAQA